MLVCSPWGNWHKELMQARQAHSTQHYIAKWAEADFEVCSFALVRAEVTCLLKLTNILLFHKALFHNEQVHVQLTTVFYSYTTTTASGYWFTKICACHSNIRWCCWSFKKWLFSLKIYVFICIWCECFACIYVPAPWFPTETRDTDWSRKGRCEPPRAGKESSEFSFLLSRHLSRTQFAFTESFFF